MNAVPVMLSFSFSPQRPSHVRRRENDAIRCEIISNLRAFIAHRICRAICTVPDRRTLSH